MLPFGLSHFTGRENTYSRWKERRASPLQDGIGKHIGGGTTRTDPSIPG